MYAEPVRAPLFVALALAAFGCSESHGALDGSTGCPGPAPTGCRVADLSTHCCRSVPAECRDGEWYCDRDPDFCEGGCETCDPFGASYPCYEDLGDRCCGRAVGNPTCVGTRWVCAPGSWLDYECASPPGEPCGPTPTACHTLTEAECVGSEDCEPYYDDFCCPTCVGAGFCADCARVQMYSCGARATCGGTTGCGATDWGCDDGSGAPRVADCAGAVETTEGRCSIAGCVVRTGVDDCPDCPRECVPVRPDSCDAVCDVPAPICAPGFVAEAESGCYTGACIAASACAPAAMIGP